MKCIRVRASALYLVIVIALVISIICSALIVTAYYYRAMYQKADRYAKLQANISSAINILIAGQDTSYQEKTFSLFDAEQDSVKIKRTFWGIYDVGAACAFINRDSLYKTFSIARVIDSSKWCALYLTDNGRPLGLSGKTIIRGDVFLPPAGVNQAYVNNEAYTGDPKLISGKKHDSAKELPGLDSISLLRFKTLFKQDSTVNLTTSYNDTINQSFRQETKVINFKNQPIVITSKKLSGNIALYSDTTITIDSTVILNNIIVLAKVIIVKPGFNGSCQLIATDSVSVGKRCTFEYPSCLGVLRFGVGQLNGIQAKVSLNDRTIVNGCIFTYQEKKTAIEPLLSIGPNVVVKGQVYAQGVLKLFDHSEIDGSVFAEKFLYQTSFTLYENYLVNVTLDENALSPYYLSSALFPVAKPKRKILEWIEGN